MTDAKTVYKPTVTPAPGQVWRLVRRDSDSEDLVCVVLLTRKRSFDGGWLALDLDPTAPGAGGTLYQETLAEYDSRLRDNAAYDAGHSVYRWTRLL